MSVIHAQPIVIFKETTHEQFEDLKLFLDQEYTKVFEAISEYEDHNNAPEPLLKKWFMLQNVCADFEIPGYEV